MVDLAGAPAESSDERSARTLIKTESLTVTWVQLAAGGAIAEHSAPGAITVQVLDGDVRFAAAGNEYELAPGRLLYLEPGVRHRVNSRAGGTFLLTLSVRRPTAER